MKDVQILLRQHVGAPCQATVKSGDKVKKGTLIAEPTGLGANIFSSVYGEVTEVLEDRIVIRPDEVQSEEFEKIEEGSKLDMVKAAGIVSMQQNVSRDFVTIFSRLKRNVTKLSVA